jgi:hypothetical protein
MPKYLNVKRVIIKKSTTSIIILIFGILSIVMVLLTYYGSYSGNFIVTMEGDAYKRGIILSSSREFTDPQPMLFADSVGGVDDTSILYIQSEIPFILSTDGNYKDPNKSFLAYTFYLKNNGQVAVDIDFTYVIKQVHRSTEEAIRFFLIEDDTIQRIYYKPDDYGEQYLHLYNEIEPIPFSDSTIFNRTISAFAPQAVKKFTIILYLEGADPDCNDTVLGGSLRTEMVFKIVDEST